MSMIVLAVVWLLYAGGYPIPYTPTFKTEGACHAQIKNYRHAECRAALQND
jgi:hypothetical protein